MHTGTQASIGQGGRGSPCFCIRNKVLKQIEAASLCAREHLRGMNHRYLNGYSYEPTWSQFFMTSSGRRAGLLSLQVLWLHVCLIISPNPLCPPSCPAPQPLSPPRPPVAECDINPEPLGMDCVMSHRLSVSFLKSKHCQFPRTIAPLVLAERRACCMATVGLPPEAP